MIRCPVCRADNSTPPSCRRCKADLSLVWSVEQQREQHLLNCRKAIAAAEYDVALHEMETARALRDGEDLVRLKACVMLLAGDWPSAMALATVTPN